MTIDETTAKKYALMEATGFAAVKHADQKRRYSGEPYIAHCLRVAGSLADMSADYPVTDDMLMAAVLHDTVEDTDCTFKEIEEKFGPTVSDYVRALSIDPAAGNRTARYQKYTEALAAAPFAVQLIKFCDLLDNVEDIRHHDKHFYPVYKKEVLRMALAMDKLGADLQGRLYDLVKKESKNL